MIYIIEVQHASDHDLDGKWYEVSRASTPEGADREMRYMARRRAYEGRPLRIRPAEGDVAALPRVNTPSPAWRRAVRRARSTIRFSR
jgi:lysylphosphatidylglycerol synthetase-like protein (DUF2156 family)